MKIKVSIFVFMAMCFFYSAKSEAKKQVALGEVTGTGVSERQIETVRGLIYSEIVAHPSAEFVEDNFDLEITADLTRLDYSYILVVYGYKKNGQADSQKAKMKNFDEIDVAVKRLVSAIIENKTVDQTARRGEVLDKEQEEPTRVKSIQGWEVAIGGAYPLNDSLGSQDPMFALAVGYFFDIQRFFVELRGDFQLGYNQAMKSLTSFTVGGHYFYHNGRVVGAYTGIELGFGGATDDNLNESIGFLGAFDVGFMLLRQADINVDLRLRTSVLATNFNERAPVTSALMVGLVF